MRASDDRTRRRPTVTLVLAVSGVLHFVVSAGVWSLMIWVGWRVRWNMLAILTGTIPAFALLAWFMLTWFAAWRRHRSAPGLLIASLFAAAAVFAYDAATRNWQWHMEDMRYSPQVEVANFTLFCSQYDRDEFLMASG